MSFRARLRPLLILLLLLVGVPALGQVPDWMGDKPSLHPDDLAKKVIGSYPTGIPFVDYDPDTGWGVGARGYYYWNGDRSDPFFAYTPYRHRLMLQAYATSGGFQDHQVDWEWLYAANTPWRLRTALVLLGNSASNYFGTGAAAMAPFRGPDGRTYGRFADFVRAIHQVDAKGGTYASYGQYGYLNPLWRARLERELLGGRVRVQGGVEVGWVRITDATGTVVNGANPDGSARLATSLPTRLREDCDAGRLVGCNGGWNNLLKLGVTYDTRDYEPDPNEGVFAELTAEASTRYLGSQFDFQRLTFTPRGYWSPWRDAVDLVLVGRLLASATTSGTPFFALGNLTTTGELIRGVGGSRTLRGFRLDRFVGPRALVASAEARWTFVEFTMLSQRFSFALAPFADTGRVFDSWDQMTWRGWRLGGGAGIRLGWNQATIGAFDFGWSSEGFLFYTEFGHPF